MSGIGGSSTGTVTRDPGGPRFLSFGTNASTLTPSDTVIFTAVLTDPDGVDNLIGGSLKDEHGGTYGAFATSGQEGSYQMEVSWANVQKVSPINFDANGGSRTFIAEFWDADGNLSIRSVSIDLRCADDIAACNGTCIDLQGDVENCGACGAVCDKWYCIGGRCADCAEVGEPCESATMCCGDSYCGGDGTCQSF